MNGVGCAAYAAGGETRRLGDSFDRDRAAVHANRRAIYRRRGGRHGAIDRVVDHGSSGAIAQRYLLRLSEGTSCGRKDRRLRDRSGQRGQRPRQNLLARAFAARAAGKADIRQAAPNAGGNVDWKGMRERLVHDDIGEGHDQVDPVIRHMRSDGVPAVQKNS